MIYFNHSMECEPSDIVRGGDFYYHSTECEPSDIVTGDDFFARLWNVNPLALYFDLYHLTTYTPSL